MPRPLIDLYKRIVRLELTPGRPFVRVLFSGTAASNEITFGGVGLSSRPISGSGPDAKLAWGIVPLGSSVTVNVPTPTAVPFDTMDALTGLFLYEDVTPGALEAAIAVAVGGGVDVPGFSYGSGVLFTNGLGYTGTLESLIGDYSGLVYSLDGSGGLIAEVTFPDGLHAVIVTHDPPLYPL